MLLIGCEEADDHTEQGSVQGVVVLRDEYGIIKNDHSGVEVTIDEVAELTSISDASGSWIIHDVESGVLTISFKKEGYGEKYIDNIQFIGSDTLTLKQMNLANFPTFTITDMYFSEDDYLDVWGVVSTTASHTRSVILFWGKDSLVSSDRENHIFTQRVAVYTNNEMFLGSFPSTYLVEKGMVQGDQGYLKAYPAAHGNGSYNAYTGEWEYSTLGTPTKTIHFEMP